MKEVLDSLDHGPDQLLRLNASPEGTISLTLDTPQPGYTIVNHEGFPVLFVGSELPVSLVGKTLDISPSFEGTQIIVS